ncbi:ABC transporter ATP-binding protein [Streptosporangium saharense]|uniref:ABC transporter ATP-binding protein n=1 Tax=Streptosporangium saharense TaxID=1706840 RepID=UPI00331ACD9F
MLVVPVSSFFEGGFQIGHGLVVACQVTRLLALRAEERPVAVGSVPVADLSPARLREHVVLVIQEQRLFPGTVRDNLLFADPTASEERLGKALAAVGADWVVSLGDEPGSRSPGVALGPGRVQQFALTRVIVADPHAVVPDETTAMLDARTARRAERSLAAVLEGRTVIAVAHRLHTAQDADRVVEVGAHDELVTAVGAHEALWRSWHGSRGVDAEHDPPAGLTGERRTATKLGWAVRMMSAFLADALLNFFPKAKSS